MKKDARSQTQDARKKEGESGERGSGRRIRTQDADEDEVVL